MQARKPLNNNLKNACITKYNNFLSEGLFDGDYVIYDILESNNYLSPDKNIKSKAIQTAQTALNTTSTNFGLKVVFRAKKNILQHYFEEINKSGLHLKDLLI